MADGAARRAVQRGGVAAAVGLLLVAGVAAGERTTLPLDRFRPAAGGEGTSTVDGVPDEESVHFAADYDHAFRPLTVVRSDGTALEIVQAQGVLHLTFDAALTDWLHVSAGLPVIVALSGESDEALGLGPGSPGLGQARFGARVGLVRTTAVGAALSGFAYTPTEGGSRFNGHDAWLGELRLAVAGRAGSVTWATNAATRFEPGSTYADLSTRVVGQLAAGARARVHRLLDLELELDTATELSAMPFASAGATTVEPRFGARVHLTPTVSARALIGVGLTDGYGAPALRLAFGLAFDRPYRPTIAAPPAPAQPEEPPP